MKPFATLGSEISKVRERVRRGAEALRPAKVASDVRDQRDRLLAKLGEQTFRLIAERKLQVPKVLQDSVEKLATLLGVQLPPMSTAPDGEGAGRAGEEPRAGRAGEEARAASFPISASFPADEPADIDEPSLGDVNEATPPPPKVRATPKKTAKTAAPKKKNAPTKKKASKKPIRR